jgi:CheY-like chemotaxis protein
MRGNSPANHPDQVVQGGFAMSRAVRYSNTMTKIAIIEDDAIISQMYRMKFEAEGFSVQTADTGDTGLSLLKDFRPDIVLLDLQLPRS